MKMRPNILFLTLCALITLSALTFSACNDPVEPPTGCVPGETKECACTTGQSGAQVCTIDRTYTACVCQTTVMMMPDGGTTQEDPDAGTPDSGPPPATVGTEGFTCDKDPVSGVEVCEEGLECFRMSSDNATEDVVSICVLRCDTTADDGGEAECVTSKVGNNLCREIRYGRDACVKGEVEEGEVAELSLLRGGPMTGCSNNLSAGGGYLVGVAYWAGSGLWVLAHDQSSCVRKCSPADATDCNEKFPYCNAPYFNDNDGVCSTSLKKSGARCSRHDGTDMCSQNSDVDGSLVCWDYFGSHEDPNVGQCMQLCSIAEQNCKNTQDPSQTPRCLDMGVSSSNPDRGMCSDECSRHPDDCDGQGESGLGQNCIYGFVSSSTIANVDHPSISFCWDIHPPILGLWENGTTFDNCYPNRYSCPNGAYCETVGFTGPQGGCFHGCTTATTSSSAGSKTGCENVFVGTASIATICEKARDPEFDAGRCMPVP